MRTIRAFAAPYGVANSYKEIFEPRAFQGMLKPCAMGFMHERELGEWTQVWEDDAGIWCEGHVFPEAENKLDWIHKHFPQVSVTFGRNPNGPAARSEFRHYGFHPHTPIQARVLNESLRALRTKIIRLGPADLKPLSSEDFTPLPEISLVDKGAFPGTHWEIMP